MKRILIIVVVANLILACSKESDKPLTGDDIVDITANKWLNQVKNRDLFFCFAPDGKGWEAEVKNSTTQTHPNLSKKKFTYEIDTIRKTIDATYEKDNLRKVWAYNLTYEDKRILELNGTSYIDATDELNLFFNRFNEITSQYDVIPNETN